MPLLPLHIFQNDQQPDDQQPTATVPDDSSSQGDAPAPMQMPPIELDGRPHRKMTIDPPIVLNGKPPPRAKMTIDPPIVLNGKLPASAVAEGSSPPPAAPAQDPHFMQFLADRADARAQLAAAQKKGDEAAKWADVGNGFRRMQDILLGERTDANAEQARIKEARNAPVEAVLAKQNVDKDVAQNAGAQADLQTKFTEGAQLTGSLDPNSPISKRARMLAVAQGLIPPNFKGDYTASMHQDMLKGADIAQAAAHAKAQLAQAGAALAETRARHQEQTTHDRNQEQIERDKLDIERGKLQQQGAKGKPIPAGVEQRILAGIGGMRSNAQLQHEQNAAGPFSFSYGPQVDALAPEIAAANSPTGRESPAMVSQAEKAIPSRFTPNAIANKYFDANHQKYMDRVRSDIQSYKQEGYDVSGLEGEYNRAASEAGGSVPSSGGTTPGTVKVINGQRYEKLSNGQWVAH
jgi:hypothetical protein